MEDILPPIAEQNKLNCASRHPGKESKLSEKKSHAFGHHTFPPDDYFTTCSTSWEAQLKLHLFSKKDSRVEQKRNDAAHAG